MKFGIIYNTGYYGTDPGNLVAVARHAEECGFRRPAPAQALGTRLKRPEPGKALWSKPATRPDRCCP